VTDAELIGAEVDYGDRNGYFVRVDVELPRDAIYTVDGGPTGWLALTADEADALAQLLRERAEQVRQAGA
jgi:hypothetical protein